MKENVRERRWELDNEHVHRRKERKKIDKDIIRKWFKNSEVRYRALSVKCHI